VGGANMGRTFHTDRFFDLVIDIASEADSAGLGQALQAGRDARAERSSPSFYVNFCCKIGPEA
jgi:hypothetical protein